MKCKCGKKSVIVRKYEGNGYCKDCLSNQLKMKFKRNIEKTVKKNDIVAVAVSGGKDSSVLLHLFNEIKIKNKIFAIAIDEGIKGYRNKNLESIKKFSKKLKIPIHVFSFRKEFRITLDDTHNKKYCTVCGILRRYLLNKKSKEIGATKLAVGHNLDDESQSILMNVLRNDFHRMKRLNSFAENKKFVNRIKPLKNIAEKEIMAYALSNKIPFFYGECPYSTDNVRRDVQKIINYMEDKYPGTKLQIIKFYENISPIISKKTKGSMSYCKCGEPSSGKKCKACDILEKITAESKLKKASKSETIPRQSHGL